MNKTFLKLSAFLMLICSLTVFAQGVKNQSEIIKTLKAGRYRIKASDYNYQGKMEIISVENDRSKPSGNYEVRINMFPDKESNKGEFKSYYRDNLAFPASYVRNSYTGMEKVQKKAGYVLNKRRDIGEERLIVLDDYIFIIEDWSNKDNYYGVTVLSRVESPKSTKKGKKAKKKKKGFGAFFKALKESVQNVSTSGGGKVMVEKLKKEVLQPYLDKAFAKQNTEKIKAKFVALQKQEDALRERVRKADRAYVKYYNDSLSNTPEYRKIAAHRAALKRGSVTVYNESGRTLWVGHDSPSSTSHKVPNGSNHQLQHCDDPVYYYYGEGTGQTGHKIAEGNTKCGGSVTIN